MNATIIIGLWAIATVIACIIFYKTNKKQQEFKFVQPMEEEESELGRLETAQTATQLEWDALTK